MHSILPHEDLATALKRWRKKLKAQIKGIPYFNHKSVKKDLLDFFENPLYLSASVSHKEEVIVSFTSFPLRISYVCWTLLSLFKQSVLPSKIILNLSLQDFPDKQIPESITKFQRYGLEIFWCDDNTLSFKKIIPTLQRYPQAIIITCDDDMYYHHQWLQTLLEHYDTNHIVAHRAHRITLDENFTPLPYAQWKSDINGDIFSHPSCLNFATGVGGIMYPPHCFHNDVCEKELYTHICPKADDIWLWGMSALAHRFVKVIPNKCVSLPTILPSKSDLNVHNVHQGKNDEQMHNLLIAYPDIMHILQCNSKHSGK